MTETNPPPPPRAAGRSRTPALVALIGTLAASALVPLTTGFEGRRLAAYRDLRGIVTICDGDTSNVRMGQVATPAECDARLDRQLVAHARPVLACTPGLAGHPHQLAAAVDLAYNIGPAAYCRSAVARRFNAGRASWKAACDAMLAWRFVAGREVAGLARRRQAERALCLRSL